MAAERIVVSYAGVHQAYQLALAAQELGQLKTFYCGLYDAPGKWGNWFAKVVGHDALASRRIDELNPRTVTEFPWPLVQKSIRDRFYPRGRNDWLSAYDSFDRWVARKLDKALPDIFVGTAAADLHCLEMAKRRGITLVHDCPGLHPRFLLEVWREAAERVGITIKDVPTVLGKWDSRKLQEYSLADVLLVYSDIHRESFKAAGHPIERLFMSPLWVDTNLWYRDAPQDLGKIAPDQPLKLLFVGPINLMKGIPFLLKAVAECGNAVQLTIVGAQDSEARSLLGPIKDNVRVVSAQRKSQLRKTYVSHDVLVLPSVSDSFGFVAMEAMACRLPVIVTKNCGVPVPDSGWRVPAMDSEGLAKRIMLYVDDRTLVADHGSEARAFATQFGPERYRDNMRRLFKDLLAKRN